MALHRVMLALLSALFKPLPMLKPERLKLQPGKQGRNLAPQRRVHLRNVGDVVLK
jgi:hypothetical protein